MMWPFVKMLLERMLRSIAGGVATDQIKIVDPVYTSGNGLVIILCTSQAAYMVKALPSTFMRFDLQGRIVSHKEDL
jgi:hypothetical protein